MNLQTCFICGHQVMGLTGQDLHLDTFYLHDDPEDRQLIAEDMFGECHLLCLLSSKWGPLWAKRVADNLQNTRRYGVVLQRDDLRILRNNAMLETAVVRSDGWMAFIPDRALLSSDTVASGRLAPVTHELTINLRGDQDLIKWVEGGFSSNNSLPLADLVEKLGLGDYISYSEAIRRGTISPPNDAGVKPINRVAGETYLTAMLSYHQFLPADVAQSILEYLNHHAS